jgi:ribonuclease HI
MDRSSTDFAIVNTDGGARPTNPGHGAFGIVVQFPNSNRDNEELSRYIGRKRTNNEAEWLGAIVGIKYAYFLGARSIELRCDSQFVCRMITGEYKGTDSRMRHYAREAKDALGQFYGDDWEVVNIKRDDNTRADALATSAAFYGMSLNPFLTKTRRERLAQKGRVVDPFRLGPDWLVSACA